MSWDDLGDLLVASLGIALLSFADTTVLSRTFAARGRYKVDASQELVGLGLANVAAGLFRGFPISASSSRTPVAEASGAKSQVTGIVGASAIVLVLLLAPGALKDLPTTALAAVVIAAAIGLFDLKAMRGFKRFRFADFVLSLVALGSVAFFGALRGIAFAVAVSLLDFVRRAWRPHDAVLGRAPGVKGYHDIRRYPKAVTVPGLLLFRWDAPLFFANADSFRERVMALVGESSLPVRWVVVAAEPITDVDTTAADMLEELDKELAAYGAELAFAELKDPVKDRLERYGLHARIGHEFFFPTVGVAVKAYVERHDVPWSDWENEAAK
jgi:MFS superfamily sulfate permease-like transporter